MLMASLLCFTSCSDDDEPFKWPIESIYGTWTTTSIESNGVWYDISKPEFASLRASITFYNNGTCYFTGSLGTGGGAYKTSGKTINVNAGELKIIYEIITRTDNKAEVYIKNVGVKEKLHVMVVRQ